MSFWLDKLAAVPRIATSAPRARARISAVAPANTTSTSPEMSVCTNRGLPVISRTSADKSYLARIPLSLATHGSDSAMLGLTYATRNLSAAMALLLTKMKTVAVIAHSLTKNSFITFVSNFNVLKKAAYPFFGSLSLRQSRELYPKLIEIRVVLGRVIVELAHLRAKSLHGLAIEVDLRLIALRQQQ